MILYLKDKYYWFKINQKIKHFLKKKSDLKILLYGYPKSGNTWLRFLIYNYLSLLLKPELNDTITFDELNSLQNNIMDRGTTFNSKDGFPVFYRTHKIYKKTYNLFDKKIFIHRNPLDTLISSYYFYKNREIPFLDDNKELRTSFHDIDFYVLYKIDEWIEFYRVSLIHADLVINYSELKINAKNELKRLIYSLNWNYDEKLVEKSIRFSSFEKVKLMGESENQQYGNGPKDGSFTGEFTRSGIEGQFYNELKKDTIDLVMRKFSEFKNLYSNCVR